jgi:hypothetical protein
MQAPWAHARRLPTKFQVNVKRRRPNVQLQRGAQDELETRLNAETKRGDLLFGLVTMIRACIAIFASYYVW